jgi:hypothetical protein
MAAAVGARTIALTGLPSRPVAELLDDAPPVHEIHRDCGLRLGHAGSVRSATSASAGSLALARGTLLLLAVAPLSGVAFPDPRPHPGDLPLAVRDTAALLWMLCFVPAWLYLRQPARRRKPLPILAIMGIEYGMYYALAPLLGLHNVYGSWEHSSVIRPLDPSRDFLLPVRLALGGWLAILVGYAAARQVPLVGVRAAERIGHEFDEATLADIGFRLLAVGLAFELLRWTAAVPIELRGTVNFLAHVTHIAVALLYALRARGALSRGRRAAVVVATVALLVIELGTGATFNFILVIFSALIGGWIGRPRVSIGLLAGALASLAIFAAVRGVMTDFRARAWWSGVEYPLAERSRIMLRLLEARVDRLGVLGTVDAGLEAVAVRSANTDLLADVVRRTPAEVPYWRGETYRSLVGFAVPRFLWPEKPVKLLGQDFGHRYDYLPEGDRRTHINLPILVEFYSNFGGDGLLLGSLLCGFLYQILERYANRRRQSLLVSACALTFLQPLLVLELDFSLQLGGLFMNAVALLLLYHLLRHFWRDRIRPIPQSITSPRLTPAVTASVRVDTPSLA